MILELIWPLCANLASVNFRTFKSLQEAICENCSIFVCVHANFEQFHKNIKLCTLKISKSDLPYNSSPCFSWLTTVSYVHRTVPATAVARSFFLLKRARQFVITTRHRAENQQFSDLTNLARNWLGQMQNLKYSYYFWVILSLIMKDKSLSLIFKRIIIQLSH